MAELLLIDSEPRRLRGMTAALKRAGHQCAGSRTIDGGERLFRRRSFAMAVLSARMPWKDSVGFLRQLASHGVPVLFLTEDAANAGHLNAIYAAASAVLQSPFTDIQLCFAVSRLLKECRSTLTLGVLRMDMATREVTRNGEALPLTAQEFELLHALMANPNRPVSREELLRSAWGYQNMGITRTVDVHVQRLRRKIGAGSIETVYRTGYRLVIA